MFDFSGNYVVRSVKENPQNNLGKTLSLSVLALLISSSLHSAYAAEASAKNTPEDTVVVTGQNDTSAADTAATDYSVPVTTAGTKMALTARDIPQSVSIISTHTTYAGSAASVTG